MNQDFEKELRRAEREKEQARRVESFWDAFRLTENGHVKSTLLLNSFCLSILFLAVYGAAFFLLTDPIHAWLALAPRAVENLVTMLLLLRGDSGASVLFLQIFGMMVPVPLLMGFGSSWWLLRRRNSL